MKHRVRLVFRMAVLVLVASGSGLASSTEPPIPLRIKFFVYYKNSKGRTIGRPNAEVLRLGSGALESVGITDADGEVTLASDDVFKPQSVALLFCDPQMKQLCSAIRLDSRFLEGFAEFNVQLPIFQLLDRILVTPR